MGQVTLDVADNKADLAKTRVNEALAKAPDSSSLLLVAGRLYATLSEYAKAEEYVRRVVAIEPANLQAYELLGAFFRRQGRTEQAIAEFDQIAKRSPNPVGAHTMIGMLLEEQNRVEEARKRYEQALAADSTAAVPANNLAWLIAEHGGNLDEALRLAQTAKAALPESPFVTDTLGWIYYKKGLLPQAVTALKESVEKEPRVATFHYHLGLSQAKNGDAAQARESLQTALKLDPDSSLAAEAKRALGAL
jgi:tetratricopeptide (TPR) repeat protein